MANSIVIELKADDKGSLEIKKFAKNLDDLDKTTHRTGGGVKRLADSMLSLRGAFAGLAGYFTGSAILGGIRSTVSAFMEEERAINALAAAMANAGRLSKSSLASLVEFSATLQRTTTVADDVSLKMMAMLQTFRMSDEQIKRTMKVMADMKVYGYNLESTAMLLGKAFVGNTSLLARYGIIVDESIPKAKRFEAVMQQLEQRFGGAAQAEIDTYGGKLEQLKNRFGDVAESIGHGLLTALDFIIFQIKTIPAWLTKVEIAFTKFDIKVRETMGSVFGSESYAASLAASKQYLKELESQLVKNEEAGIRAFNAIGGAEPGAGMKNQAGGAFGFPGDTGEKDKIKQQQEQYRDLLRSVFADRRELVAATQHAGEIAKINNKYDELINKVSGLDKLGSAQKQVAITAIEHNREIEKQNLLLREQQDIYADMLKTWQKVADLETDALQRLVDANVPITEDIMERIKTYSQNAPELIEPYLESKGAGGDKGSQGIASLGKLFGVSAGPIMGKEFWTSFKKEWSGGGAMGKLGALGNLAGNMMGLFEMGKNAPSQGYAVAGGAVSGALSGAGLAASMGASMGMGLAAGGIGAVVGAGIAAWGASEEKKKAAEERRAQRQAEADKYSAEFKGLAEEGFYPTFGTKISGGMWQSSKEEMDRYLGIMKNLSKRLSEAIAGAFNEAMNSPTLASAMESFSEKFAEETGSIIVSQSSEIGARMIKTMFAPAFQGIDELTYYFEQKWSEATQSGKDDIAGMFSTAITPAKEGFEFITAFVGKFNKAVGAIIGTVFPKMGTAITAILDIALANSGMMIISRLVMQFGALIGDLITTLQKKFEKRWGFIIEAAYKLSRNIEKKFDLEPDWIKELRRSGIELSDDMGRDMVSAMKDAWSDLRKTITSSLEEAFNAYTISGGWRTFQDKMREGIRDFIVKGLANALVAGGILMGAIGPFIKDIVKLFAKSLKGGFDVSEFGRIISGITQNVDQIMGGFLPVFEKLFPMIKGLDRWASGTGGISSAEVGADLSLFGQQKQRPETGQTWGSGDEALTVLSGLFSKGLFSGSPVLGSGWDFPVLSRLAEALNTWSWPIAAALAAALAAWQWPILSAVAAALNAWQMPVLTLLATALKNWDFPILNLLTAALNAWKFPLLDVFIRALNAWKFPVINNLINALNAWSFPLLSQFTLALKSWNFPVISGLSSALTFFGNTIVNLIAFWNNLLTRDRGSSGGLLGYALTGPTGGGYMTGIPSYATGTDYVPRTGVYRLHQGEAVIPAGSGRGITVHIENINISGSSDAKRIARELGYEIEMAMKSLAT